MANNLDKGKPIDKVKMPYANMSIMGGVFIPNTLNYYIIYELKGKATYIQVSEEEYNKTEI